MSEILAKITAKKILDSAGLMQIFVPILVREVIDSGHQNVSQFVELINDRVALRKLADGKKANPGNRVSKH